MQPEQKSNLDRDLGLVATGGLLQWLSVLGNAELNIRPLKLAALFEENPSRHDVKFWIEKWDKAGGIVRFFWSLSPQFRTIFLNYIKERRFIEQWEGEN